MLRLKNSEMRLYAPDEGSNGAPPPEGEGTKPGGEGGGETPPAKPALTELTKDPEYQSQLDKIISKSLETAKAKWDEEAQKKQSEAEKLAQMTADQKAQHLQQQKEKEISDREMALAKREMEAVAKSHLLDAGLSADLAVCLDYTDADKCKASIESLSKAIGAEVEKQVNTRLRGDGAPKDPKTKPEQAGFEQRLTEARKTGKTADVVQIKQDAAAKGIYLY